MPQPVPPHSSTNQKRLLITAGPTHEPIDAVRYIGNRSSGRLGIALADRAAGLGWTVKLLLGPTNLTPADSHIEVRRFRTTAELDALLRPAFSDCDVLIMAAAVADFRPRGTPAGLLGKLRRGLEPVTLTLEPTRDLLAGVAAERRPDQTVVGFALEPAERLIDSAKDKLRRKGLDMIVANPLTTIESDTIDATIFTTDGSPALTPGSMTKTAFASVLLSAICAYRRVQSEQLATGVIA